MSWQISVGAGLVLGVLHLVVFTRGISALLGGEGSPDLRRTWGLLAGGRFLMTLLLGVAATRLWGLSPIGIGGGLVLAFMTWKLAAVLWAGTGNRTGRASKENPE